MGTCLRKDSAAKYNNNAVNIIPAMFHWATDITRNTELLEVRNTSVFFVKEKAIHRYKFIAIRLVTRDIILISIIFLRVDKQY